MMQSGQKLDSGFLNRNAEGRVRVEFSSWDALLRERTRHSKYNERFAFHVHEGLRLMQHARGTPPTLQNLAEINRIQRHRLVQRGLQSQ
jgi:hypothetical protein